MQNQLAEKVRIFCIDACLRLASKLLFLLTESATYPVVCASLPPSLQEAAARQFEEAEEKRRQVESEMRKIMEQKAALAVTRLC